jgi:hypothetical protein
VVIKIKDWIKSTTKKHFIKSIRRQSTLMGHDLSYLTDEQLEAEIAKAGIAFSNAGIEAAEATKVFRKLTAAIQSIKSKC